MKLDMTILYVSDVAKSVAFFSTVLDHPPVEASPGFALFLAEGGLKLGLWKKQAVAPAAAFSGASAELVLHVADDAAVDALVSKWISSGLSVIDPPTRREFGYSFVVEGPDAERLRVLHPGE